MAKNKLGRNHTVNSLIGFKFKEIYKTDCDIKRIQFIEAFIQMRVKEFLSWNETMALHVM